MRCATAAAGESDRHAVVDHVEWGTMVVPCLRDRRAHAPAPTGLLGPALDVVRTMGTC
jgi:hypothetical protein